MNTVRRLVMLTAIGLAPVACGGKDDNGTGPPGTAIDGVALDRAGEPIAGATVVVAGQSPVTTGSDGRFSIPGVAASYDVAVLPPGKNTAIVYTGLTRRDPTLVYLSFTGAAKSATISGTVPSTASSAGMATYVFFATGPYTFGGSRADPTTGAYSFTVTWNGASDTQVGRLHVFAWTEDAAFLPTSFDGYASKPLTISAGGAYAGNDFSGTDLVNPPDAVISGSVSVPAGYTQTLRRFFVFFDRIPVYWEESSSLGSTFSYTVPVLSGVTFGVMAEAVDPASRSSFFTQNGIITNATNVSITLQPGPQLTQPADGAVGVDASTSFSWNEGGGNGVDLVRLAPDDATNMSFWVLTAAPGAKILNVGTPLPATAGYHWLVDRGFPIASMDAAADAAFLDLIGWDPDHIGETLSESFAFTTKGPAATAHRSSGVTAMEMAAATQPWRGLLGTAFAIRVNRP